MTPWRRGLSPAQLSAERGSRLPLLCRRGHRHDAALETEANGGAAAAPRAPWGPDGDGGPTSRAPASSPSPSRRPPVPSAAARASAPPARPPPPRASDCATRGRRHY